MSTHDLHEHNNNHTQGHKRIHSIDLSLALEQELDNESLPPTPGFHHRPQSLDPHVVASIVTQLRLDVAEVTKERDELAEIVASANGREADLKDALQLTTDKCTAVEQELEKAKTKIQDDEEAINMLRHKVEESRRGLMRLQTESRRVSQQLPVSLDLSRAGLPSFGGSPSGKRASFTPLTGSRMNNGHRRISSVSDSGFLLPDVEPSSPGPGQTFTFPPNSPGGNHPPVSSKRFSGLFGRTSPPELVQDPEMEGLRRELKSIKAELEETRHELTEANEAREASETCVKALRTFIEENKVGEKAVLGDPRTKGSVNETESKRGGSIGSGWAFNKLWKADPVPAPLPTQPPPAPLTTKLGNFFGSRASVSSTTSSSLPAVYAQEPLYNGSDTSSIEDSATEPISPASEGANTNVIVRGKTSSDLGGRPEQMVLDS